MAIKPILFNTDMVRAIFDGRKTVTRRVIKPQPMGKICYCMAGYKHGSWSYPDNEAYKYWGDEWKVPEGLTSEERNRHWTPPCHTDDVLYVRETWNRGYIEHSDAYLNNEAWFEEYHKRDGSFLDGISSYMYRADFDKSEERELHMLWRPSLHMPKEAARIFLRVTDVYMERLQEIDDEGSKAEGANYGIGVSEKMKETSIDRFAKIWDSTIKKNDLPRYGWNANPWVWVIQFERCEKPLQFADTDAAPYADQPVLMPAT